MAGSSSKLCTTCGQTLPISQFWKKQECRDGRMPNCRACAAERRSALHQQKSAEWQAEFTRKNRKKAREWGRNNSARAVSRANAWRKANPEKNKAYKAATSARRRAQTKGGATGPETQAWFNAQRKVCHWCGLRCADAPTIDHRVPLTRGGKHEIRNLLIACHSCNARKQARDPIEWAQIIGKLL